MKLLPASSVVSASKAILLPAYKEFPNTSLHNLPIIVYRPFDGIPKPHEIEDLVTKNGYQAAWRYGMFPFNHYHSNTHEVGHFVRTTVSTCFPLLRQSAIITASSWGNSRPNEADCSHVCSCHTNLVVVSQVLVPYSGSAELAFGHSDSPKVYKHQARPGDVYILPAGVAHRSLSQSSDFSMVGSYPVGAKNWDNCRGESADSDATRKLWQAVKELGSKTGRLSVDPIFGNASEETPLQKHWITVA